MDIGVGFGNILQTLVLQATPSEWGSVSWDGANDVLGVAGDDTHNMSQTQTVADMKAKGMNAGNLLMVFNLNQTGPPTSSTPLDLHEFTVNFYASDGTLLFAAPYVEGVPGPGPGANTASSLGLTVNGQGQGSAGYIFPVTFAGNEGTDFFSTDTNRIGVSVPESDPIRDTSDDGPEGFYVAPEPATLIVLALGLLPVLIGKSRRFNSNRRMRKTSWRGSKQ